MDNWTTGSTLAGNARQYGRGAGKSTRPPADPLGLNGFPRHRNALDFMVRQLCETLRADGSVIGGKQIARMIFHDDDTRRVRHLVAYARVHHHIHQVVGVAGSGYLWADPATAVGRAALHDAVMSAMRMGRCFFYIGALHRREGTAMAAVQMVFNFMEHNVSARHSDDLAAMVASEGVGVADFLDAFVGSLAKTEDGRRTLAQVGRKHAQLLMPADVLDVATKQIEEAVASLRSGTLRKAG